MNTFKFFIIVFAALTLSACGSNDYKVEVDLSDQELQTLQADLDIYKENLANFYDEQQLPIADTLALAVTYAKMGEVGEAIELYEGLVSNDVYSSSVYHNLGRLYEKVGEYDKAVATYQQIVEKFFMEKYLYDITWAYIKAEDRKNAEKYFNAWQLAFKKTDGPTQTAIKKLRDAEKAEK